MAVASVIRIRRFDRLLERTSSPPPSDVVRVATEIAAILGLRSVPDIALSSARVSPMTWWMGRRVRIIIPRALAVGVDRDQLRWVLAHELAHVRRHDHLVRWLEWVARVVAWWNPVVWWAQRHLREAEELSCDALVLERLRDEPRSYARALLAVVEFLAQPTASQPVLATGMGAGATLERRFRRIVTDRGRSLVSDVASHQPVRRDAHRADARDRSGEPDRGRLSSPLDVSGGRCERRRPRCRRGDPVARELAARRPCPFGWPTADVTLGRRRGAGVSGSSAPRDPTPTPVIAAATSSMVARARTSCSVVEARTSSAAVRAATRSMPDEVTTSWSPGRTAWPMRSTAVPATPIGRSRIRPMSSWNARSSTDVHRRSGPPRPGAAW